METPEDKDIIIYLKGDYKLSRLVEILKEKGYKWQKEQAETYSKEEVDEIIYNTFHASREMYNGFSMRLLCEDNKNIKMCYPKLEDWKLKMNNKPNIYESDIR